MSNELFKTVLPPRVDFNKGDYETIIFQKGRDILFEKALMCPCKSPSINQLSNCKNCGGTGWIYTNPKTTRMVIQGVSFVTEYKVWSEETRGMVNVTCSDEEQLTFMDRITILDGMAIHNEVVHIKKKGNKWFYYTAYPVKNMLYSALFSQADVKLSKVDISSFTANKNLVEVDASAIPPNTNDSTILSLTLRYQHAPVYYVMEMKRESMQSYKYEGGIEKQQYLPLSAVARRAHYVMDPMTLNGVDLLNNDYEEIVNTDNCNS